MPDIPKEVTIASYIILADIFTGIIVSAIMFDINGDWTAGLGLVVSVVGIWVFMEIRKLNPQAWQFGIILNFVGIALYLLGDIFIGISGALLCIVTIIYLYSPNVRVHFGQ
ncbi:MAG: hypothetical protein ACFFED_07230 [Candidatus Thorarchaeota archaeon]